MKLKLLGNKKLTELLKNDLTFLPLIFVTLIPFIYYIVTIDKGHTIGTNFFTILYSILIPLALKNTFNIKSLLFLIFSIPFVIISIIYTVSIFDYRTVINVNTWEVILNTNGEEIGSFYSAINNKTIYIIVGQIIVLFIYLYLTVKEKYKIIISSENRKTWAFILLFICCDFLLEGSTTKSFPFSLKGSFLTYLKEKKNEIKNFEIKKNVSYNAKRSQFFSEEDKETIVVVVGESLRRDHLQYYGYKRLTTPLLNKEDIICYSDVVSPANQSVLSLKRIFSQAEYHNISGYEKFPSFIQAFKEVGFDTYWLSTQRIYGIHDSEISYIAREADKILFKDYNGLDEQLFEPFKKVLSENKRKKIIFIHILGNHFSYKKRIHSTFEFFNKEKTNKKKQLINQYDDAVRYNDYILSYFLNELKKQKGQKSFFMFSDHGESLFDSGEDLCYHSSINPAKSEFDIPFVLWFSESFKKKHNNSYKQALLNKDEPIIFSDFFYALPAFYGIRFKNEIKKKCFLNNSYVPIKNRKVLNSNRELLTYDNLKIKVN